MELVQIRSGAPATTDIPGQLRQLAADIESGAAGAVNQIAIVTDDGKSIRVYGWGEMAVAGSEAHLLLSLGVLRMEQYVMEERSEPR
jgi:hypothetical protein